MSAPSQEEVAKWLIVGFAKSWSMEMLRVHVELTLGGKSISKYPFLPTGVYWYGKSPVRGFVAANYPKLADFLDRATAEQKIRCASEIVKLTPTVERPMGALNRKEQGEIYASKQELRRATTAYRESRKAFKRAQGTAWNVCK